jgi:hypothetical protein
MSYRSTAASRLRPETHWGNKIRGISAAAAADLVWTRDDLHADETSLRGHGTLYSCPSACNSGPFVCLCSVA